MRRVTMATLGAFDRRGVATRYLKTINIWWINVVAMFVEAVATPGRAASIARTNPRPNPHVPSTAGRRFRHWVRALGILLAGAVTLGAEGAYAEPAGAGPTS